MNPTQDDKLEYVIHQESLPRLRDRQADPLTVRAIINHLANRRAKPSDSERAFLAEFSAAGDRGTFIEDRFLRAAIERGKTVREEGYQLGDEPGGWFGISLFFGLYAVHFIQYGEGQDDYGPFRERKEADAVFDVVVALNTPG